MKNLFALVFFLFAGGLYGQKAARFFPEKDLMPLGVYYYPEHWPKSQWERDFKNMASMGFEFTHVGEFAWSDMEPEEGKFNFEWIDEMLKLSEKHKLKMILCTPTPTPPAWLTEKYPELLIKNAAGRTAEHGARTHASWSSMKYREYIEKIVTRLAQRYGNDKRVWGWQIDNEPSHYGFEYDHSEPAQQRFRAWLQQKYGTIDKLNKAWGTAFWSLTYNNFGQIRIPNPQVQPQMPNPHAMLDFKRFSAVECADFISFQYNLLRKYISKDQWVTTNFMGTHWPNDIGLSKDLDFITYTTYPVAGYSRGIGEQGFRLSMPNIIGFSNDFFRPVSGITGVMELQPGQVNWGTYNPQPLPGAVRLWLYHAFAGGCRIACSYRFRQPLYGGEQYHYGMVGPDGVTPLPGGLEYSSVAKEMQTLRKAYEPGQKNPAAYMARKTALMNVRDNIWDISFQPQTKEFNIANHKLRYYTALKTMGAPVDVVGEEAKFEDYKVVLAPAYQVLDKALIARWKTYVEAGGHLVLTCRSGQKDRNGHLWEAQFQQPIWELIGAKVLMNDMLPADYKAKVAMDGNTYEWNNWADIAEPMPGTAVWATFADQYYAGRAAVTHRKLGKGSVTFVGPDTDDGALEKATLNKLYKEAGIAVLNLPEHLVMEYRDGFGVALNYHSTQNVEVPLPANAKILIGEKNLKPAGVLVWQE